jgi:hypothetical protein
VGTMALFQGVSSQGIKLITHLHLVPKIKNEWCYTPTPLNMPSFHGKQKHYLCLYNLPTPALYSCTVHLQLN